MNSFRKLFVAVIICMICIAVIANLTLINNNEGDKGRPYRVEAERIAYSIEHAEKIDISGCKYVTKVVKLENRVSEKEFYDSESDYLVMSVNGDIYRFDYRTDVDRDKYEMLIYLNVSLGIIFLFVIIVLLYIRSRIIAPFDSISSLPEQLAKEI